MSLTGCDDSVCHLSLSAMGAVDASQMLKSERMYLFFVSPAPESGLAVKEVPTDVLYVEDVLVIAGGASRRTARRVLRKAPSPSCRLVRR